MRNSATSQRDMPSPRPEYRLEWLWDGDMPLWWPITTPLKYVSEAGNDPEWRDRPMNEQTIGWRNCERPG